jgi:hypothetical protein
MLAYELGTNIQTLKLKMTTPDLTTLDDVSKRYDMASEMYFAPSLPADFGTLDKLNAAARKTFVTKHKLIARLKNRIHTLFTNRFGNIFPQILILSIM